MTDEFLYQFRKEPRPDFSSDLRQKIMPTKQPVAWKNLALERMAFSLAALTIALTFVFFFSSGARATLGEIIEEIGGLVFTITDQNEFMRSGDENLLTEQVVSISEANSLLPFEIRMPTWVPEGFEHLDQVRISKPQGDSPFYLVTLEWNKVNPMGRIELLFEYRADGVEEPYSEIVGPGGIEKVKVNGQPAALVRGAWNYDTGEYDPVPGLDRLKWYQDHVGYTLSGTVTTEELIRIAESLP